MTLLKNQVVQAQCPNCKTGLRIPASWVGQMMRCKHCKQEFQARAPKDKKPKERKSILAMALQLGRIKKKRKRKHRSKKGVLQSRPVSPPQAIPMGSPVGGMPPIPGAKSPPAAIPVGRPGVPAGIPMGTAAVPMGTAVPMGMPPPPVANAFANINDGKHRRRGGKQKLAFLLIFLLAIGGLGAVVYNASQQKTDGTEMAAATADEADPFKGSMLTKPAPPTIGRPTVPQPPVLIVPQPPKQFDPPAQPPIVIGGGNDPAMPSNPNPRNRPPVRPPVTQNTRPIQPNQPPVMVPQVPQTTAYDNMPRRMFAVVPSNYYYANPVSTGSAQFAVQGLLYQFADMMKIPPKNVVVVSDRPPAGQKAVPPIKPVIDLNLTKFLDSCRPVDRIVVFYMGHGVEIEGVPYLMPLEGEKDKADDLIPLDWLFQKLAQCSARQKVLVLDVCRYDPTKGEERGTVEPMGLAFDNTLQNPPPGVQVFSACAAGQYSYEVESNSQEFGQVNGGLMLSAFPDLRQRLASANTKPEDPMPIESLASGVAIRTRRMAEFFKFTTPQTPKMYGESLETGLVHDAEAPPAPKIEVELAGIFKEGVASEQEIRDLFINIEGIPAVKREGGAAPAGNSQLDYSNLPPFAKKSIDPYKDDGKSSPIRVLVQEAIFTMKDQDKVVLNLRFTAPAANQNAENAFKAQIENTQKQVSLTQYKLTVILDELKMLADDRAKENKRWQVVYDYVCARLEARIAYLYEYNAQLGNIRREFPARDPAIHIGWQLASRSKLSDREAGKNQKSAMKYLDKIATENGGTPWAMLAKREQVTSLGLDWVPLPK